MKSGAFRGIDGVKKAEDSDGDADCGTVDHADQRLREVDIGVNVMLQNVTA